MECLVHQIAASLDTKKEAVIEKALKQIETVCSRDAVRTASVYKRSVDARRKPNIRFVYSVLLDVDLPETAADLLKKNGIEAVVKEPLSLPLGKEKAQRPVVVGFGPGGMFCALLLAQNGYRPIVIERGGDVDTRTRAVAHFCKNGILDENCNVQFGAGGAGTFSDGKLVTRIHDPYCRFVLESLVEFGAPAEILTQAKPHIGTDLLRKVVANAQAKICALGGEIHYHTRMTGLTRQKGRITAVKTDRGEIPCGSVVLAIGHSARDVYSYLQSQDFAMEAKPFSIGVRIEHLQKEIDFALYGERADHPQLKHAEYALSHFDFDSAGEKRCVYSFCMCPGGTVMASASEDGGVVTNGMSTYARNGRNANAALAVTITPEDCRRAGMDGVAFQRHYERLAYAAGGRDYRAPAQTVGDFLSQKQGSLPTAVTPTYRDGAVTLCDLHAVLPQYVSELLTSGLYAFDRKICGFASASAMLTGVETRTSAPLRILRNPETYTSYTCENLYPCGEGAGYAGGITSAAVDGMRCAKALMQRYSPMPD
jgi:uncharacterized FAD-dependent dehydrogenase